MTQDKKLKRQIRDRAARKGESYGTARRNVLAERSKASAPPLSKTARAATKKAGAKGTVSDAKVIEKTGHSLAHWFVVLDRFDAAKKGHKLAARHLLDDHNLSPWYSQGITVSYERARGLRAINQTSRGFQVSVSRVLPATFDEAVAAVSRAAQRKRWLPGSGGELTAGFANGKRRFKREEERVRLRWKTDNCHTELSISATDDGRSRAYVMCNQMTSHEHVELKRAVWKEIFDALRAHLNS